jgi:hypothetical protein
VLLDEFIIPSGPIIKFVPVAIVAPDFAAALKIILNRKKEQISGILFF